MRLLGGVLAALSLATGCDAGDDRTYVKLRAYDGQNVCALDADGFLHCWGPETADAPKGIALLDFDLYGNHGCAVLEGGGGTCWTWDEGAEDGAELGFLDVPEGSFREVATAGASTCWSDGAGDIRCVGSEDHGQLVAPGVALTGMAAGGQTYCGLDETDEPVCWGFDGQGEISLFPVQPYRFLDVQDAVCGIAADGSAVCAGDDRLDENPSITEGDFVSLDAGGEYCMVTMDGEIRCESGLDNSVCSPPPGDGHQLVSSDGLGLACATHEDGGLACWIRGKQRDGSSGCITDHPEDLDLGGAG